MQWPLSTAFQKDYVFPNTIYIDGVSTSRDGVDIGGDNAFPCQKMLAASNAKHWCGDDACRTKYLDRFGGVVRKAWNDYNTGRYAASPVYYPSGEDVGICWDPTRAYKLGDDRCAEVVECKSDGRTLYVSGACPQFPCEGGDCNPPGPDENP